MQHFIFHQEIRDYQNWLQALNYSKSTIYYNPKFISWFLGFVVKEGVSSLEEITKSHTIQYYEYLTERSHQRQTKPLSPSYIGNQLNALRNYGSYVQKTKQISLPLSIVHIASEEKKINVLTRSEITQLYQSCAATVLGLRDRAMLSIYYGCGLRRNEGIQLKLKDIDFTEGKLTVQCGKGGKRRTLPFNEIIAEDLKSYLQYSRPFLYPATDHLLVSSWGNPCSYNLMIRRLQLLVKQSKISQDKKVGLHTLRHSIATHLYQAQMPLEHIQQFLGHSSLQSTQIYTHVESGITTL